MKIFLILLIAISIHPLMAQNGYGSTSIYDRTANLPKDKHLFELPPAEYWYSQPWRDSLYTLPEFLPGKLELKKGGAPILLPPMNYSMFLGMFLVKQDDGDIAPLDYSRQVKYIWIGDQKFMYSRTFGYLHIIMEGRVSVAERTFMNASFELGSAITTPLSVSDNRTATAKSKRYYWEEKQYFIFTDPSRLHHASTITHLFPSKKDDIKSFAKNNHIDYKKKDDVLKIVAYANKN